MRVIKPFLLINLCFTILFSQAQIVKRIGQAETQGSGTGSAHANNLYNQATELLSARHYAEAIKLYKQTLAVDSNYTEAIDNLGLAYYELNNLDSAEYYFNVSLRKLPNGQTALQNLGLINEARKDYDKALECYQAISRIYPNSGQGFYNQARVYGSVGMLDRALPLALQAEKLFQKTQSADLSICHDLLLKIYFAEHNLPKAKEYLALCKKDNLEIDPDIEKALH
jgi:tetratricopeptide (TPR) repeat protein